MQPVKKADTGVDTNETSAQANKQQIQHMWRVYRFTQSLYTTFTNAGKISKHNTKAPHFKEQ